MSNQAAAKDTTAPPSRVSARAGPSGLQVDQFEQKDVPTFRGTPPDTARREPCDIGAEK